MPGTALPALVVPRTSMGTRSHRSESSLNMRWATYPDAPVRTTRRLATVYLLDVDALHLGLGIARAVRSGARARDCARDCPPGSADAGGVGRLPACPRPA